MWIVETDGLKMIRMASLLLLTAMTASALVFALGVIQPLVSFFHFIFQFAFCWNKSIVDSNVSDLAFKTSSWTGWLISLTVLGSAAGFGNYIRLGRRRWARLWCGCMNHAVTLISIPTEKSRICSQLRKKMRVVVVGGGGSSSSGSSSSCLLKCLPQK